MKEVRSRLTYANVMSSIAVFLVLGGATAFAASHLAKNSVGSKQLKKNSVTAAKIKKNAITAAKIKDGAVGGAKVDEASLGTVPSAASAASAANAAVAASLTGYTHNSVRLTPTPVADREGGITGAPGTAVVSAGPLSVIAKCFSYGGYLYGVFQIKSTEAGSVFDSAEDETYGSNLLGPDTPASEREMASEETSENYSFFQANGLEFAAAAPGGPTVRGDLQIGVKQGSLTGGQGIYGPGDVCLMSAEIFAF